MEKNKNDVKRNPSSGKGYKITKLKTGYWLALFRAGEFTAFDGWDNKLLRHAKGDGELFINEGVY